MADFTIGDYGYTVIDSTNNYLRVQAISKNKIMYANISTSETVVDMLSCYQDCTAMKIAVPIPQGVTNLYQCYQRCTNLQSISVIPSSVTNMEYCFQNCTSLTGTIHVYNNPTSYTSIFSGTTKPIYIVPHGSAIKSKWQTIAASYSNVTVLNEPALDTYYNETNQTGAITFGGYDESSSVNKITSYLDFQGEQDIYLSENNDSLNGAINSCGWGNLLEENDYFNFEIVDPSLTAYVGIKIARESFTINTEDYPAEDDSQYQIFTSDPVFQYSFDKNTWSNYTLGTSLTLGQGGHNIIYFRGDNLSPWEDEYDVTVTRTVDGETRTYTKTYYKMVQVFITRPSTGSTPFVKANGNIMSLRYKNFINQKEIPCEHAFSSLFKNCALLIKAPVLPATILKKSCYGNSVYFNNGMFYNCVNLTIPPQLPALKLAEYCYAYMFYYCTSLTTAPVLPATTLAKNCYQGMFYGCSNLKTAPKLSATTLDNSCYTYMFYSCSSLTTAPTLPATTLADDCYSGMFSSCSSLTTAPALPATTLANTCYTSMFSFCSHLTTAPVLPATTLAESCYRGMFSSCSSLTTAPTLSVTTLAKSCYAEMFSGCTSLTTPPALPATTLTNRCYTGMFYNCTSLTQTPALPATTLAESCYGGWLNYGMFEGCTSLTKISKLPATDLPMDCYHNMFKDSNVKISATSVSGCSNSFRIPTSGTGSAVSKSLDDMFNKFSDNSAFTPDVNKTYYITVPSF